MNQKLMTQLAALMDVAEAVRGLRAVVTGPNVEALSDGVKTIAADLIGTEVGGTSADISVPETAFNGQPADPRMNAGKSSALAGQAKAVRSAGTAKCTICGKEFIRRSPIQKTCTKECAAEKNRRYAAEKNAKHKQPAAKQPAEKTTKSPHGGFRLPPDPIPKGIRDAASEAREADNMG